MDLALSRYAYYYTGCYKKIGGYTKILVKVS